MDLVTKIEEIVDIYLKGEVMPQELVASLSSEIDRTFEEDGELIFTPVDDRFNTSHILFETGNEPRSNESLRLRIQPQSRLKLSQFEALWGEASEGPMRPSSSEVLVPYDVQRLSKAENDFSGRIRVELNGRRENPDASVVGIAVFRRKKK